ncbi:MAG: DNA translocase FtsK [Candidatus Levybacteria bacterium]|nr:DNA translocase FtsK [Candidatus Levybacteria bacterium]
MDSLFEDAVRVVAQHDRASASLLQRRLNIGYARAARILDELEEAGIVSHAEGSKPRDVLVRNAEEFIRSYKENPLKLIKKDISQINEQKFTYPLIVPSLDILPKHSLLKQVAEKSKLKDKEYEMLVGLDKNTPVYIKLDDLGNIIITGTSYSGKENILDAIILSLLYEKTGLDIRFILADSTCNLNIYNGIPQRLTPCLNSYDKFESALKWSLGEIDRRNKIFAERKVRNFESFNNTAPQKIPRILFIIRNIEDFITDNDVKEMLKTAISMGGKTGFHFILLTDRLCSENIPTAIKSNIPNRIIFQTGSEEDSALSGIKDAQDLKPKTEFILKLLQQKEKLLSTILVTEDEINSTTHNIPSFAPEYSE